MSNGSQQKPNYDDFDYPSYDLDESSPYAQSNYDNSYSPDYTTEYTGGYASGQPSYGAPQTPQGGQPQYSRAGAEPTKKRKRATVFIIVFVVLALIAVAVAGYFIYTTNNKMKHANEGTNSLHAAIASVSASDKVVVPMDNLINSEVNDNSAAQIQVLVTQVPQAVQDLEQAQKKLDETQPNLEYLTGEQKEVAGYLKQAIDGRREMLTVGQRILQNSVTESQAQTHVNSTYTNILTADEKVREAVAAAEKYAAHQKEQAQAALDAAEKGQQAPEAVEGEVTAQSVVDLDQAALDALDAAKKSLDQVKTALPNANVQAIESYLDAKITAVTLLKETDTAIAANDVKTAVEKVKEYNEADATASELAKALPKEPKDVLASVTSQTAQQDRKAYDEARKKTAAADAHIRAYQGVDTVSATGQPAPNATGAGAGAGANNAAPANKPGVQTIPAQPAGQPGQPAGQAGQPAQHAGQTAPAPKPAQPAGQVAQPAGQPGQPAQPANGAATAPTH